VVSLEICILQAILGAIIDVWDATSSIGTFQGLMVMWSIVTARIILADILQMN
jgi:hypothetical protein